MTRAKIIGLQFLGTPSIHSKCDCKFYSCQLSCWTTHPYHPCRGRMKKKCILKLQNRQVRFHCSIFRHLFWFRNELFLNLNLTKIYLPVESLIYKKMQISLSFKTAISQAIHVKEDFWNLGDCSPCQGWITRIRIPLCSCNPVRSHDRPSHMEEQS